MQAGGGSVSSINAKNQYGLLAGIALIILLLSPPTFAMNCKATISPLVFGTYMPMRTSHLDVTGQIDVRCQAQPGSFSIVLSPGSSGDPLDRVMIAGVGDILSYNLFLDAARTQIWGDGSPPTLFASGSRTSAGRPSFHTFPVYGRIFANQAPDTGTYADNIVVTVLF